MNEQAKKELFLSLFFNSEIHNKVQELKDISDRESDIRYSLNHAKQVLVNTQNKHVEIVKQKKEVLDSLLELLKKK